MKNNSTSESIVRHTIHLKDGSHVRAALSKYEKDRRIYVANDILFYTDHLRYVKESHPIIDCREQLRRAIKAIDQHRMEQTKKFTFEYTGSVTEMKEKPLNVMALNHEEAWKKIMDTYFWLSTSKSSFKLQSAELPVEV